MRRIRKQDQEQRFEHEKCNKFKGSARIKLEHLNFSCNESRELDVSNVKRLVFIFEDEGCFHENNRNHIPAVINEKQLDVAIRTSETSYDMLLGNRQTKPPQLQFPSQFRLECLHGRHRIQAGREMIPPQLYWTVDLYLAGRQD